MLLLHFHCKDMYLPVVHLKQLRALLILQRADLLKETDYSLVMFYLTVTEREIMHAIGGSRNMGNRCVWFHRVIRDINNQEKTPELAKFLGKKTHLCVISVIAIRNETNQW